MAKTTARDRRAAGREQRRSASVDESLIDEATEAVDGDPADALRTAASAAIAAAAVGAARALARRRHEDDDEDDGHGVPAEDEGDEPVEPEAAADDDRGDHDREHDREEEREEEREAPAPRESVSSGDARRIVDRAREQLNELHGADAESVSSVRRTADGWCIGLEVVEVHRIPESTDVLATYEVELDDDGDLITFARTTRYYRSEADRR
jgi:hypothetical protein